MIEAEWPEASNRAPAADGSTPVALYVYVENVDQWRVRARRWLDYHVQLPLERDAIFIIDDASPYVPDDADVRVIDAIPASLDPGPAAWLYRFGEREGRTGMRGHRGWWRSFLYSLDIARTLGFDKIVHVESDAYLLSHVVHDWPEAQAIAILTRVREAIAPTGRLLVVEMVLPADDTPHPARMLDIVMLMLTGGEERTEDEYAELLARAGFRLERVIPTKAPVSVLEALPV